MSTTIEIRVDKDRLGDLVTVDDYLAVQEGNTKAIINMLSCFVVDKDGRYLDPVEGRKIIGKLTLNQLTEASAGFLEKAEGAAVPPSSGQG